MVGQTISHYRIDAELGRGGMGVVYRARDEQLDRDVALKVLRPGVLADETARKQFRKEALALAKLNHPNVETVFEFSSQGGVDFLAMELIAGSSLSEKLKEGPLAAKEIQRLGIQFAEGLAAAHKQGVVHRDLKPANLFVTPDGRLKILDFGLAKLIHPELITEVTQSISEDSSTISGTIPYMSPEQLRGLPVDTRSDIYAAGAVLYEMATGQRPFPQTQSSELIGAILHQSPAPPASVNPRVSPGLERSILKALEKDASQRYQSARELLVALEGTGSGLVEELTRQRTVSSPRVKIFATCAVLAILIAVGLVLGLNIRGIRDRLFVPNHSSTSKPLTESAPIHPRRSVAVLGFKNLSGRSDEAWLSTALSEMLTTELAAGGQLRTVPGEDVAQMKVSLSLPDADAYGKETLARIRKNLNADEVVLGSYMPVGNDQIRLDLRLQDAARGELLAAVSEKGSKEQIDELVSRAGATLREKLGIGEVSSDAAIFVKGSLPTNPQATKLYSEGLAKLRLYEDLAARDLLAQAVAADPEFALAHSALAMAWGQLGFDAEEMREAKKAYDLSANLPREDRLLIEGHYRETTKEWDKAIGLYQTLFESFPDNVNYGLRVAGAQLRAAKSKAALLTLEALRKLPAPARDDPRIDLTEAGAAFELADFSTERTAAARAAEKGTTDGARHLVAHALIYQGMAYRSLGEPAKALTTLKDATQIYAAVGDRAGVARGTLSIANLLHDQGQLAEALKMYREVLQTDRQIGEKRGVAAALGNMAIVLAKQGKYSQSIKMHRESLASYHELGLKTDEAMELVSIGEVLSFEGDLVGSKKTYEEALRVFRELGNKDMTAFALSRSGQVLLAQDDLAGARQNFQKSLELYIEAGNKESAAEVRASLAELSIEEEQPAEARELLRQSLGEFQADRLPDDEADAQADLARCLLALGDSANAEKAMQRALELSKKSQDRSVRLSVGIKAARFRGASKEGDEVAEAIRSLREILAEAQKAGLLAYQFEARLALGELEMRSHHEMGGARLAVLENEARAKGFLLIARKAAAAASKTQS